MASETETATTADATLSSPAATKQTDTTTEGPSAVSKACKVCGVANDGRKMCHFVPTPQFPEEIYLHVFCGKTAAILPNVNRPDLEILTKAGVKNKHGTGVSVTLALQRCRSAKVLDSSNREQEYFLSKEFEQIYHAVTKEPAPAGPGQTPTHTTTRDAAPQHPYQMQRPHHHSHPAHHYQQPPPAVTTAAPAPVTARQVGAPASAAHANAQANHPGQALPHPHHQHQQQQQQQQSHHQTQTYHPHQSGPATVSATSVATIAEGADTTGIGHIDLEDIDIGHQVPNPMYAADLTGEATVTPEQDAAYHDTASTTAALEHLRDDDGTLGGTAQHPPAKRYKASTEHGADMADGAVGDISAAVQDAIGTTGTAATSSATATATTGGASQKSPYDLAMERLQSVCDRCQGVGYSLVRGVARDEDEDNEDISEDGVETFDPTKCSQAQVDHVRVIVITKERQECLDDMGRLILGAQFGASFMSFTTSFSYQVLGAWQEFTRIFQCTSSRDWKRKFDLLLGFTDTLKEHDVWVHDHEVGWGGELMIKELAGYWKKVLKRTDQELGIDPEYTRPGIVALLEQFRELVESVDTYGVDEPMRFAFC